MDWKRVIEHLRGPGRAHLSQVADALEAGLAACDVAGDQAAPERGRWGMKDGEAVNVAERAPITGDTLERVNVSMPKDIADRAAAYVDGRWSGVHPASAYAAYIAGAMAERGEADAERQLVKGLRRALNDQAAAADNERKNFLDADKANGRLRTAVSNQRDEIGKLQARVATRDDQIKGLEAKLAGCREANGNLAESNVELRAERDSAMKAAADQAEVIVALNKELEARRDMAKPTKR